MSAAIPILSRIAGGDLSLSQVIVLLAVATGDDTVAKIMERTALNQWNVHHCLNRLRDDSLVRSGVDRSEPNPGGGRRISRHRLTPAGGHHAAYLLKGGKLTVPTPQERLTPTITAPA